MGVTAGAAVTGSTGRGEVTAPAQVTQMPDGVVWLPTNSDGVQVRLGLAAAHGSRVKIRAGGDHQ